MEDVISLGKDDLKSLDIKFGSIQKIIKAIEHYKSGVGSGATPQPQTGITPKPEEVK